MGKNAFVTGSSNVTGKGIALELARAGYNVGVTYTTQKEGGEDTVRQIEAMGVKAKSYFMDSLQVEQSQKTLADFCGEFGPLDVMVNNVGITKMFNFLEISRDEYDYYMNLNLRGTFFLGQAAAKDMVKNKTKGVIINISSVHALGTWPHDTIYATSKAAIARLTQAQALELAKYGIRVNAVAPGFIRMTGGSKRSMHGMTEEQYIESEKNTSKKIPLNRYISAAEIGRAVVYMASDDASYITGQSLYMDGGILLPVAMQNEYS